MSETINAEVLTEDGNFAETVPTVIPKEDGAKSGTYVHKFKKPFEYEGKKYETINFYFDKLTGDDIINIEIEMQANNEYALAPELSRSFQSKLASRAGNIGSDAIRKMPIKEFNKITNAARSFLLANSGD